MGSLGFAVHVAGVRPQNIDFHAAVDGQGGDERLIGRAAVERHPDDLGGGKLVDAHAVGVDQLAADVRLGVGENFFHGVLLGHHAVVQNGDPVADFLDDIHLVGDDHHSDAQLLVQLLQQIQNRQGRGGVQGRGRLVTQQDLGVRGQGAGDGHALLRAG